MVFESLVTELVNKYLGDFIENLDSSQLKIGIWGGELLKIFVLTLGLPVDFRLKVCYVKITLVKNW